MYVYLLADVSGVIAAFYFSVVLYRDAGGIISAFGCGKISGVITVFYRAVILRRDAAAAQRFNVSRVKAVFYFSVIIRRDAAVVNVAVVIIYKAFVRSFTCYRSAYRKIFDDSFFADVFEQQSVVRIFILEKRYGKALAVEGSFILVFLCADWGAGRRKLDVRIEFRPKLGFAVVYAFCKRRKFFRRADFDGFFGFFGRVFKKRPFVSHNPYVFKIEGRKFRLVRKICFRKRRAV